LRGCFRWLCRSRPRPWDGRDAPLRISSRFRHSRSSLSPGADRNAGPIGDYRCNTFSSRAGRSFAFLVAPLPVSNSSRTDGAHSLCRPAHTPAGARLTVCRRLRSSRGLECVVPCFGGFEISRRWRMSLTNWFSVAHRIPKTPRAAPSSRDSRSISPSDRAPAAPRSLSLIRPLLPRARVDGGFPCLDHRRHGTLADRDSRRRGS